jgi:nitroimidazol reductase NimA-like FMN-containing flavoprotein (pyridoxamine 5'-phosphate oxidase superfamily)
MGRSTMEAGVDRLDSSRRVVRSLLSSQQFTVLSTGSESGPYASLVAFSGAEDLSHVVFATMRATRKFNHLTERPQVALLFDNRSNRDVDVSEAVAVTATGYAREITDFESNAAAIERYLIKHPHLQTFVASPGCALVKVEIDVYYVVTHFQSVVELRMPRPGQGLGPSR